MTTNSRTHALISSALTAEIVDIHELKHLCWNGIDPEHRALAWKILLRYAPVNLSRRDSTISKRRREYFTSKQQNSNHLLYSDNYVNNSSLHSSTKSPQEVDVLYQIQMDVMRTCPTLPLFREERVQQSLTRLLYTHACRHPATSYVQGMNDIAASLFSVFLGEYFRGDDMSLHYIDIHYISDDIIHNVEADSFYCFTNLLADMQDHYTVNQPGILAMIAHLKLCLEITDEELYHHLATKIDLLHFSFRWMNCFLVRELSHECIIRMWDTYFSLDDYDTIPYSSSSSSATAMSTPVNSSSSISHTTSDTKITTAKQIPTFHVYVCTGFLHNLRDILLDMNSEDLMEFLTVDLAKYACQNITIRDVEIWLSQAYIWTTQSILQRGMASPPPTMKEITNNFLTHSNESNNDVKEDKKDDNGDHPFKMKNIDDNTIIATDCLTASMSDADFLWY